MGDYAKPLLSLIKNKGFYMAATVTMPVSVIGDGYV